MACLGIPQRPPPAEKKKITITPVMEAPRSPFSPQSPPIFFEVKGGGGGVEGTGYRLRSVTARIRLRLRENRA